MCLSFKQVITISIKFALSLHYFDESDKSNMISYYCAIYVTLSYLWKILFLVRTTSGKFYLKKMFSNSCIFVTFIPKICKCFLDTHTYQNLVNAPIDVHI